MKKKCERLKSFIRDVFKNHWKPITVFSILNLWLYIYDAYIYEDVSHKKLIPIALVGFILIEFLLVLFYYHLKKKNYKIEKIFLMLAIPLGVLQAFITPINQVPDEIVHIFRVYDVSEGKLVSPRSSEYETDKYGNETYGTYYRGISSSAFKLINDAQSDSTYYKRIVKQMIEPTAPDEWHWSYGNTVSYRPVAYAPQAVGLAVGRALPIPIGIAMYLARIFAVLAFAFIIYFAIKLTPRYKEFFAIFGLLPLALQQAASFSVDSMVIASCFFMIAIAMKYIYGDEDKKLGIKALLLMTVASYVSAATKSLLYLPLGLLLVLIPAKKFKKPILKYVFLTFLVALSVGAFKIWGNIQDPAPAGSVSNTVETTEVSEVTIGPSSNPLKFIILAFGTFFGVNTEYELDTTVGTSLSYNTFIAPARIYVYIFIALLVVMVIRSTETIVMRKFDKLIIWVTPMIILFAMYYVAYYDWRFVSDGGTTISGIQGRYILPFLPLIPFMVHRNKNDKLEPLSIDYVFLFAIFSNVAILSMKLLHNI